MTEILDAIILAVTVALTWLGGETGRAAITGGMGGIARWFGQDIRTIRTGMLAWAGGAISGVYLTPIVMWMAGYAADPGSASDERVTSAFVFVTGAVGISLLKIIMAGIEARAKKWGKSDE